MLESMKTSNSERVLDSRKLPIPRRNKSGGEDTSSMNAASIITDYR